MVPSNVATALICTTLLSWSGASYADQYRPGEFFRLDLSSAVLSPKPLGPATSFVPGPLDVNIDPGGESAQAHAAPPEPTYEAKAEGRSESKIVIENTRLAEPRVEQSRHVARMKLAHHHRNPLDAQAFDARIQTWPCKSGGICNWKR